jgi:hypothetical protein
MKGCRNVLFNVDRQNADTDIIHARMNIYGEADVFLDTVTWRRKHFFKCNQFGAQFILSIFINLYMFRATMNPSSEEKTVLLRHLVLVIVCEWLSGLQSGMNFHSTLHTRQSSTQNNKDQVSQKHSCLSWWWVHSRTKHVENDKYKYTKNKLCTKLVLSTRLYRDAWSTEHKKENNSLSSCPSVFLSSCCLKASWN